MTSTGSERSSSRWSATRSDPSLWDDPARGQRLTQRLARLRDRGRSLRERLERALGDLEATDELLEDEADAELTGELAAGLERSSGSWRGSSSPRSCRAPTTTTTRSRRCKRAPAARSPRIGPRCSCGCTRAGRSSSGFGMELDEIHHGEEAGIKSATFTLHGTNAYGLLSAERGVHRLVRISPFDAQKRRHTSFAALDVIPLLEASEDEEVEIDEDDLPDRRLPLVRPRRAVASTRPTRRCGSPTCRPGSSVACQNERSQLQNRAVAMRILKARLAELERQRARRGDGRAPRRAEGGRLRHPDPFVRARAVPDGEGPPDRR